MNKSTDNITPMTADLNRFKVALKKFFIFEEATGNARHLPVYCEILKRAYNHENEVINDLHQKEALNRLVQAGFIFQETLIQQNPQKSHKLLVNYRSLSIQTEENESDLNADWPFYRLSAKAILRFYSMKPAGIQWILHEVEQELLRYRKNGELNRQLEVISNIKLISKIWAICLHYELSEVDEAIEDDWLHPERDLSNPSKGQRLHIKKEKLGLTKPPSIYQILHIKANAHYHRKALL